MASIVPLNQPTNQTRCDATNTVVPVHRVEAVTVLAVREAGAFVRIFLARDGVPEVTKEALDNAFTCARARACFGFGFGKSLVISHRNRIKNCRTVQ